MVPHRHLFLKHLTLGLAGLILLAACGAHVHHRVRPGETLYAIGWRYNVDYRDLARWNGIDPPYLIRPGQVIRIAPPRPPWWENEKGQADAAATKAKTAQARRSTRPHRGRPAPGAPSAPQDIAWRWPVEGPVLRAFDLKPPANKGIDIGGAEDAPVRAAADGEVVYAGQGLIGYGNLVIVKHDQIFLSAYAHNKTLLVKEGERVRRGQVIARMGRDQRGRVVLHFEIRRRGRPEDPMKFLPRRGGKAG